MCKEEDSRNSLPASRRDAKVTRMKLHRLVNELIDLFLRRWMWIDKGKSIMDNCCKVAITLWEVFI